MSITIPSAKLSAVTIDGKYYLAQKDIVTWFLESAKENPTVAPIFVQLACVVQTGIIREG